MYANDIAYYEGVTEELYQVHLTRAHTTFDWPILAYYEGVTEELYQVHLTRAHTTFDSRPYPLTTTLSYHTPLRSLTGQQRGTKRRADRPPVSPSSHTYTHSSHTLLTPHSLITHTPSHHHHPLTTTSCRPLYQANSEELNAVRIVWRLSMADNELVPTWPVGNTKNTQSITHTPHIPHTYTYTPLPPHTDIHMLVPTWPVGNTHTHTPNPLPLTHTYTYIHTHTPTPSQTYTCWFPLGPSVIHIPIHNQ